MIGRSVSLILTLILFHPTHFAISETFTFKRENKKIEIYLDGSLLTAFHFEDQWAKPFLYPLIASNGLRVSRGYPVEDIPGEIQDHPWHRGLWYAHGDICGMDYWREDDGSGKRFPLPLGSIAVTPQLETRVHEGKAILSAECSLDSPVGESFGTLIQEYTIFPESTNNIIDVRIVFRADQGIPLEMGDTEEGCLGVRLRDEFRQDRGATLLNEHGQTGTENIWGKRAKWVDYSTTVEDQKVGVALFDHPGNHNHPTFWHARGYGLCSANPFGMSDFMKDKSVDGSLVIPEGEEIEFKYRVVIHLGDAQEAEIHSLYRQYDEQG